MELQIAFCLFATVLIACCQGKPGYIVGNVGGKTAATYRASGSFGYKANENDTGINIAGKVGADHYVAGNSGFAAQVGSGGEKGGKGLALGVRSSLTYGAHAGAGATGNWFDKKINADGNVGFDRSIDKVGANIGVYSEMPDSDYNPWDHIGKYRKRRGSPIAVGLMS